MNSTDNKEPVVVCVQKKSEVQIKVPTGLVLVIALCAYYFLRLSKREAPKIPSPIGLCNIPESPKIPEKLVEVPRVPMVIEEQAVLSDLAHPQSSLQEEERSVSPVLNLHVQCSGCNAHLDSLLFEALGEQIDQAKKRGVKVDQIPCDRMYSNDELRGADQRLSDLLAQKIEYAKSKGIKTTDDGI